MRRLIALLILTCSLALGAGAKPDSSNLRISLLTCSPGTELYSTFGHSALRIIDSAAGTDIVYNYGVFDFGDPDFYLKFVRGKLLYYLDQQAFPDFIYGYSLEGRQISEQVLDLPADRKTALQRYLFFKVRPENRSYTYDFLFDNCTTRLRDLILNMLPKNGRVINVNRPEEQTFRNHLHKYLDENGKDWSKLGIDILLGKRLDKRMNDLEAMFLPDFLEIGINGTTVNGKPLVMEKTIILPRRLSPTSTPDPPFSLLALGLLAGIMLLVPLGGKPLWKKIAATGDFLLFFTTGLLGFLLLFMWVATDHQICKDNMNLLWAMPTHLPAAFFVRSSHRWARGYFKVVLWLSALLLLAWPVLTQSINLSLIPLVVWMGFSSLRITRLPKQ